MSDRLEEGGCLCGAVRYSVRDEPTALVHCRCRSCRRAAGAPSLAWVVFPAGRVEITAGELTTFASSRGVERGFCGRCGTSLTYRRADRPAVLDVTTASLDHPDRFAPTKEIWTEGRLAWMVANEAMELFRRSSRTIP